MPIGTGQGFADVRSRSRQGIVGDWVYNDHTRRQGFGLNADPQAVQVTTVTLAASADNTVVTITINGVDVSINSGTGLTAAQEGALLAAAINNEPLVRGQVVASFDTLTLTLTGINPGVPFTVSENSASLSAVTTTVPAAYAAEVPFGRVMVRTGSNPGGLISSPGETGSLVAVASNSVSLFAGTASAAELEQFWAGISLYSPIDVNASGVGAYMPNVGVKTAVRGVVWVDRPTDGAIVHGAQCFVETAPGADAGKLFTIATGTRVALPTRLITWERDGLIAADGIAAVRLEA